MVGLYIHIPFCSSKCKYCDFVSYTSRSDMIGEYVDAVIDEAKRYAGETADTVFIGGGTPSILPLGEMTRLIEGISKSIDISKGAEFTVEVNPNSVTEDKAKEYFCAGVNRVSIGLQTTNEALLRRIGRTHSVNDFLVAVDTLRDSKIENINADMMYSLPGQTVKDVEMTAKLLASLQINHVSAYALKLEEGTPMYKERPVLPDEDADREMFYKIRDVLETQGIIRYEISNFARPGYECAHNLKYWHVEDYIGLGASSHSCYKAERYFNTSSLDEYIEYKRRIAKEAQDIQKEKLMLNLRLTQGISLKDIPKGEKIGDLIRMYISLGAAKVLNGRFILTDRGLDVQNYIVSDFFTAMEE